MNDQDDPKLNKKDKALWDDYVRDIVADTNEETEENFEDLLEAFERGEDLEDNKTEFTHEHSEILEAAQVKKAKQNHSLDGVQLDRRTEEKLRKGKMRIEALIDLHGMTREVAHEALENFIIHSAQRNLRHVLVITGKGKSKSTSDEWLSDGQGVLRQNLPLWLDGAILKPYVLKYMHAQPKDGGSGAFYVYLRRQR